MSLVNTAFRRNTNLSAVAVKQMQRLNGMKASIYFPASSETIYNDSSQSYTYNSSSDLDGEYLFTGIFGLEAMTGLELEGYSSYNDGEGRMYIVGEDLEIPRNSKVEVFFNAGLKIFRTQDLDIVYGIDGKPVYGVIDIIPVS